MKKRIIAFICLGILLGLPIFGVAESIDQEQSSSSSEFMDKTEETQVETILKKEVEISETIETRTSEGLIEQETLVSEESVEEQYLGNLISEGNQSALGDSLRENQTSFREFSDRSLSSNNKNAPRIDFVDVASYQGNISVQDYLNMKGQGITGVVVKLTEGTSYTNPFAANQIKNAKEAGLKVSAYHYSWFINKKTAEEEARYFAGVAKKNGLGIDTVMVNDAEQYQINNGKLTDNSIFFTNTLKKEYGFKQVVHYSMASWFTPKILDMSRLGGNELAWKAEFPYSPSNNNLLHIDSASWQWSSDTHFVGDSDSKRLFDTNVDYKGVFSASRNFEYIPINKKTFINKSYASIYNRPYQSGVWKQDTSNGMEKQLINVTAQSRTSYGLWYEFSYTKNGINKVGWIKSVDVSDIIDEKEVQQTLFVNKDYGSVYNSPYTPGSKKIDTTSSFKKNEFNKIREAKTGYGLWYYGSYTKNEKLMYGWIKSVDLDVEKAVIIPYSNKGIINKNYGTVYTAPYVSGVKKQDTLNGTVESIVVIKAKSQTKNGLWYQSTYVKNGKEQVGWIKSVDIDFIRAEKNDIRTLYVNKDYGSIYDSPYTTGSRKIDITNNLNSNEFKKTKEARTGYGLWYYGSYNKNGKINNGWIKSVDLNEKTTTSYVNKGFINKSYGSIYKAPYVNGVAKQDTIDGKMYQQVISITGKSTTSNGLWYQANYKKNGVIKVGWIKYTDIDFVINEKNDKRTMRINKDYGSVYNSPYTTDSKKIDVTANFNSSSFEKSKQATTAYGHWYYGSYLKNGVKKNGWIKSVDLY